MQTRVPFVDLKAQFAPLQEELLASISRVLDSMRLFLGPETEGFESEFAAFCGTNYAVAVDSGTSALYLALRALNIGPGDEVITVSNTFIATAGAIVQAGATPVLVDVEASTALMNLDLVEAAITPRTKAIIPVHLYGRMVDMDRLMAVAKRHGLAVVEDACQAHGAKWAGRPAGAWGDFGCFSFYFSKNLGAYGETGLVTTSSEAHAATLRALRDHGSETKYQHSTFSGNWRPDEIQTAMLRVKLRHLAVWNQRRRAVAEAYRRGLAGLDLDLPAAGGDEHVWHLFVVACDDRDGLRGHLGERGVEAGIHYPVPIHLQPAWRKNGGGPCRLPVTEELASRILSLPIFPEISAEQIDYVCRGVAEFVTKRAELAVP